MTLGTRLIIGISGMLWNAERKVETLEESEETAASWFHIPATGGGSIIMGEAKGIIMGEAKGSRVCSTRLDGD